MPSLALPTLTTFDGGLPTSADLIPALTFAGLYMAALLAAVWRAITYLRSSVALLVALAPPVFAAVRIATFSIRAVEAANEAGRADEPLNGTLFIVDQSLLGTGYLLLMSTLIELIRCHSAQADDPRAGGRHAGMGRWIVAGLVQAAVISAVIFGAMAASKAYESLTSSSASTQSAKQKTTSTIIAVVVAGSAIVVTFYLLVGKRGRLSGRSSAYLFFTACMRVIEPAYKLVKNQPTLVKFEAMLSTLVPPDTKLDFWILQAAVEFVVLVLLLAVDARTWFGAGTPPGIQIQPRGNPVYKAAARGEDVIAEADKAMELGLMGKKDWQAGDVQDFLNVLERV